MKIKDASKFLNIVSEYFETQGNLDFEISEKLCDIIPELEEQSEKHQKLIQKFIKEYYNIKEEKENGISYVAKDLSQLDLMASERSKIDNLEWVYEKKTVAKPKEIPPKVLLVLKNFFIFE